VQPLSRFSANASNSCLTTVGHPDRPAQRPQQFFCSKDRNWGGLQSSGRTGAPVAEKDEDQCWAVISLIAPHRRGYGQGQGVEQRESLCTQVLPDLTLRDRNLSAGHYMVQAKFQRYWLCHIKACRKLALGIRGAEALHLYSD